MSKQSEAKTQQVYVAKPSWPTCATCENFTSEFVVDRSWTRETNLRCKLGCFKVLRGGTCSQHHWKRKASDEGAS